jgi:CHAT domain-containing protein
MIKFYQVLLNKNQQVSVAVALKIAQNWLKILNREAFIFESNQIIDKVYSDKPKTAKSYKEQAQKLVQGSTEYPFDSPFYWAAFIASGQ